MTPTYYYPNILLTPKFVDQSFFYPNISFTPTLNCPPTFWPTENVCPKISLTTTILTPKQFWPRLQILDQLDSLYVYIIKYGYKCCWRARNLIFIFYYIKLQHNRKTKTIVYPHGHHETCAGAVLVDHPIKILIVVFIQVLQFFFYACLNQDAICM